MHPASDNCVLIPANQVTDGEGPRHSESVRDKAGVWVLECCEGEPTASTVLVLAVGLWASPALPSASVAPLGSWTT